MNFFFFNDPATTEIYTYLHTLSLRDALPISDGVRSRRFGGRRLEHRAGKAGTDPLGTMRHQKLRPEALAIVAAGRICFRRLSGTGLSNLRSEEHTSELQSLMRISYAVFCLTKKKKQLTNTPIHNKQSK